MENCKECDCEFGTHNINCSFIKEENCFGEVKIVLSVKDFEYIRKQVKEALSPKVVFSPQFPENMEKEAMEIINFSLYEMEKVLDKYENMDLCGND